MQRKQVWWMYGIQNNPMLQIKIQKDYIKESKFQDIQFPSKNQCWRNKPSDQKGCLNNKFQERSSLFVSLEQVYPSHKRTLWMEEPISNSQIGRSNQGRLRRQMPFKMKSIKRMLIAWEWGTNEYICLTLLRSCGVISSGNQNTEAKWISYFGLGRVIKTPGSGYPNPKKMTTKVMQKSYILG